MFFHKNDLRQLALQGKLSWEGKKVTLDPFTPIEIVFEVDYHEDHYIIKKLLRSGTQWLTAYQVFENGVLDHQIFRYWKDDHGDAWISCPHQLKLPDLKIWHGNLDHEVIWKCPIPE